MKKIKGVNGISQVATDNQRAETEKLTALVDYIAMMSDVEIPIYETEEAADNEQI